MNNFQPFDPSQFKEMRLEEGTYTMQLTSAGKKITQRGDEVMEAEWTILEPEAFKNRKHWENFYIYEADKERKDKAINRLGLFVKQVTDAPKGFDTWWELSQYTGTKAKITLKKWKTDKGEERLYTAKREKLETVSLLPSGMPQASSSTSELTEDEIPF